MALLRSDVLNRELVERMVMRLEGSKKTQMRVMTLTVAEVDSIDRPIQRFVVQATVRLKWSEKTFSWVAKLPRLETDGDCVNKLDRLFVEIRFYERVSPLLPSTLSLAHPIYASLDGDNSILLLNDILRVGGGFRRVEEVRTLNYDDCAACIKWLAKFHAATSKVIRLYPRGTSRWIFENQWVKRSRAIVWPEKPFMDSLTEELLECARKRGKDSLAKFLSLPNWLEILTSEIRETETSSPENRSPTLCHGSPWRRNAFFVAEAADRYASSRAAFVDFSQCHLRPDLRGAFADVAHFLVTSTTQDFRIDNADRLKELYKTCLGDSNQNSVEDEGGLWTGYLRALAFLCRRIADSGTPDDEKDFAKMRIIEAVAELQIKFISSKN